MRCTIDARLARGWSEQEFAAREARQESCELKRKLADVVIDNSGSEESTRAQVEQAWNVLSRPVLSSDVVEWFDPVVARVLREHLSASLRPLSSDLPRSSGIFE